MKNSSDKITGLKSGEMSRKKHNNLLHTGISERDEVMITDENNYDENGQVDRKIKNRTVEARYPTVITSMTPKTKNMT